MAERKNRQGFATRGIHAGQAPDPTTGAIMPPIYQTSTFVQSSPGVHKGYEYARTHNPTRMAYERCIADLESGVRAFAFASGLAAEATVLDYLEHGSHVLASEDLYGGTYRLFARVRAHSAGLETSYADFTDRAAIEAAIRPNTRLIWVESPSNPLLRLVDLAMVAEVGARARHPDARRQHVREPLCAAPARAGLRPRAAFRDEVFERPFRHGGRHRRGRARGRARATGSSSCRTHWARCRARSIAFSRCAG